MPGDRCVPPIELELPILILAFNLAKPVRNGGF